KGEAALSEGSGDALPRLLEANEVAWRLLSNQTMPKLLTQACRALDDLISRRRWLLWMCLPSLAPPWQVPQEYLDRYFAANADDEGEEGDAEESDDEAVEEEVLQVPWLDPPVGPIDASDDHSWQRLQNTYAGVVSHLDTQLGQLLEELEQRKL